MAAGSYTAGSLLVRIVPDARGAVTRIRREMGTIPDPVVRVEAEIREAEKNITRVREQLRALEARKNDPKIDLDIRAMEAKIAQANAKLEDLRSRPTSPRVTADIAAAEVQLARFTHQLDELNRKKNDPQVDIDIADARAKLAGLRADLSNLGNERTRLRAEAETDGAMARLRSFKTAAQLMLQRNIEAGVDVNTGPAMAKLALFGAALRSLGTIVVTPAKLVALVGLLGFLGAEASSAAGALWLLPAAIFTGALAVGALKVATAGVGEAIGLAFDPTKAEQFAEAMAKLSPEARASVLAVQGLKGPIDALKMASQDALFSGFAPLISSLGSTYLPIAEERFVRIAGAVNYAGSQFGGWLQGAYAIGAVKVAGDGAAAAFENIMMAAAPLASAFIMIAAIGTPILAQLTAGAGGVAGRFAAWVGSAAGIQTITGWIWNAIFTLRQMWALAANVGLILGSMFGAASSSGEGLLSVLVRVTGGVAAALRTPEGAAGLAQFFGLLRAVVAGFAERIGVLWPLISAAAVALFGLWQAGGPVLDVFFRIVVSALTPLVQLLGVMAPVLGPVIAAMFLLSLATTAWGAATAWATGLAFSAQAVRALLAIATWALTSATWAQAMAQWGVNSALLASPYTWVVIALVALVAAVIYAYQNFEWFRTAVNAVGSVFVWLWQTVLQPVVDFLWGVLSAAIRWVGSQWSWLSVVIGVLVGPIGWVILAFTTFRDQTVAVLAAVGGALVWLWQTVFVPAWNAISMAVSWAWANVISPVLTFLWTALRYLGAIIFVVLVTPFLVAWNLISMAVSWAWNNVISPLLTLLWTGLRFLGAIIFVVLATPFMIAWNLISAAISFAWNNVIRPIWDALVAYARNVIMPMLTFLWQGVVVPVWNAIGAVISAAWNGVIRPVWDALVGFINGIIIPLLRFLWQGVVVPIWNGIGAAISFAWNSIILPIWNALVAFVNGVIVPLMRFLLDNVVRPIWDGIGSAISAVWTGVIKPAWDAVAAGLMWLRDRFNDGVNQIGQIWNGIKAMLAKPINFMIDVVWNRGVVPAWNKVAGLVGLGPIQPLPLIPEFASGGSPTDVRVGGQVRGPGTGTSDSIVARLSNREFVVREKVASRVPHFLRALNDGQPEAMMAAGGPGARMPGYRSGGPVEAPDGLPAYAGGGALEAAINFARGESGKPYQWAGVGNPSWDCSGFMSGITNVLRGQNPRRRIGATGSFPWPGFRPGLSSAFSIGSTRNAGNGIGHMAGTLAGNNVESGGSNGVRFGPPAIGADNGLFNQRYHLPEVGGVFASGGAGGGGGGGFFDFISPLIRAAFNALTNPAIDLVRRTVGAPPPEWRAVPPAFATKARDSLLNFMLSKVTVGSDTAMGPTGRNAPFYTRQISDAARMLGLGRDGALVGVATALVETDMRMAANPRDAGSLNFPHDWVSNDHDSSGLFQQRPNGEWGTVAQRMNPLASALMFYKAMLRIVGPGWRANLGEAAARTQRPAAQYRGRYAQRMGAAASLVDAHGGPFDRGGVARGMGFMTKATWHDERVLDPVETRQYDTLGPLVREMEAARLPVQNTPSLTAAQIAAMGGGPVTFPSSFRLSSDTALRLDGDGVLHIVDGRLDALADALDAGRTD